MLIINYKIVDDREIKGHKELPSAIMKNPEAQATATDCRRQSTALCAFISRVNVVPVLKRSYHFSFPNFVSVVVLPALRDPKNRNGHQRHDPQDPRQLSFIWGFERNYFRRFLFHSKKIFITSFLFEDSIFYSFWKTFPSICSNTNWKVPLILRRILFSKNFRDPNPV